MSKLGNIALWGWRFPRSTVASEASYVILPTARLNGWAATSCPASAGIARFTTIPAAIAIVRSARVRLGRGGSKPA